MFCDNMDRRSSLSPFIPSHPSAARRDAAPYRAGADIFAAVVGESASFSAPRPHLAEGKNLARACLLVHRNRRP